LVVATATTTRNDKVFNIKAKLAKILRRGESVLLSNTTET
jgi:hypothetical protein